MKTSTAHEIADDAIRNATRRASTRTRSDNKMMEKMSRRNEPVLHEELTNRKNEILMLISEGKSNQEIADELFITLKTVKTHVSIYWLS